MNDRTSDHRVKLALQLLTEALGGTGDQPRHQNFAEQRSFVPSPALFVDEEMSATDLLSWWFQPDSGLSSPWDDYFDRSFQPVTTPNAFQNQMQPAMSMPFQTPSQDRGQVVLAAPADQPVVPWIDIGQLFKDPMEELADQSAEAVVECFYGFLHAFGRRDIDAAMEYVSDKFHIFENGKEIDRLGLRQQLEVLLGSLRDWEFDVSLVEIPTPIYHSSGALIYVEIQVEAYHPQDELRRSIVERRIAVFKQQGMNEWKISALSPVEGIYDDF